MYLQRQMIIFAALFLLSSCVSLNEPVIKKGKSVESFKYAIMPVTGSKVSTTGAVYGNQTGIYGSTSTREVNPGALIEGFLLKRGMVILNEIQPQHKDKTLIVRYGESRLSM